MKYIYSKFRLIILVFVLTPMLSACLGVASVASILYSTTSASNDRRTLGTILDNKTITFRLSNWTGNDENLKGTHLNFMAYDKNILITGEVPTQKIYHYIDTQIKQRFPAFKYFNETKVAKTEGLLSRAKDATITAQVEALLFKQEVFHPSHVHVMTENNTVYLMGELTKREADMAAKTAARASGVVGVVKIFNYLRQRPANEIARDKARELKKQQAIEAKKRHAKIEAKKAELRRQINALNSQDATDF
jgi:osmotically-inducible protein OsmY